MSDAAFARSCRPCSRTIWRTRDIMERVGLTADATTTMASGRPGLRQVRWHEIRSYLSLDPLSEFE
jgi:hypothetical protein